MKTDCFIETISFSELLDLIESAITPVSAIMISGVCTLMQGLPQPLFRAATTYPA